MEEKLTSFAGMSEEEILIQVKDEYERGYFLVENLRERFESDLKVFNNQKKNKEKIGDTTFFNVHSALMARTYLEKPEVVFMPTEDGNERIAGNLQAAYREDFETEELEMIKYQRNWDIFFYGVGIVAKTGWDGLEKKSKFETVDPRLWIPDPDGDYTTGKYSFTGFEKTLYKSDLVAMGLRNEDLNPIGQTTYRGPQKVGNDDKSRSNLNISWNEKNKTNPVFQIYYHFASFNGEKALVITGNDNGLILSITPLKSLYKYENEDKTKVPFPFSFTYWKPRRGMPFGERLADFIVDVQNAKALIANLRYDKAKAELYPMYLANSRLIKNKTELDFGFNKIISVNPLEGEDVTNALKPLQKDFRADNSYLIDQSLDSQVEKSTSIGAIQQGSSPERREAATTNKLIQGSTDVNIALTAKMITLGDKQMATLWLRGLTENFTKGDKKLVRTFNGITFVPTFLSKDDLVLDDRIKIVVSSSLEISEKKQKQIQAFNSFAPLMQTLNLAPHSINYLYRDLLRNLGYEEASIWKVIPESPEEIIARQNVALLNLGEMVDVKPEYDPLVHLDALVNAKEGFNVEAYKQGLLDLYLTNKEKGIEGQQVETNNQNSLINNIAAQAGAGLQNASQTL